MVIVKNMLCKINNMEEMSILIIKCGIILSISYFVVAIVCKITMGYSESLVKEVNNIINFVNLGVINFFASFVLGIMFNGIIKITSNSKHKK